jgi:hypothetical protein
MAIGAGDSRSTRRREGACRGDRPRGSRAAGASSDGVPSGRSRPRRRSRRPSPRGAPGHRRVPGPQPQLPARSRIRRPPRPVEVQAIAGPARRIRLGRTSAAWMVAVDRTSPEAGRACRSDADGHRDPRRPARRRPPTRPGDWRDRSRVVARSAASLDVPASLETRGTCRICPSGRGADVPDARLAHEAERLEAQWTEAPSQRTRW